MSFENVLLPPPPLFDDQSVTLENVILPPPDDFQSSNNFPTANDSGKVNNSFYVQLK